ncbi:MAG: MATE family efflux transporter [Treponema sp.]|nr:MATE family efflux transporter [Treponema sp.]
MKKNQIDMTEGSIAAKLIAFSVPLIISSILQLLFNAADIIVVGRFAGDNSLAAVGSTASLIHMLVNLFTGLATGTTVVAANYFGARDKDGLHDTVHTSMVVSVWSGIILTVVGIFGAKRILLMMGSPVEVLPLAQLYLKVYFAGITASMVYNFGSALLRAKGDTQRPLVILLIAGVINVVLNLVFVIPFHMDVAGVALATVLSQLFAAVVVVVILLRESDGFQLNLKDLKINRTIFSRIVRIGVPAGVQGILFSFSNVIIQSSVNSFGPVVIAGNSAGSNIEGFVWTSMNGLSQGVMTFAGQNLGAGKIERIRKLPLISQIMVIVEGLVLGNIVVHFSPVLLSLYTRNPEVIAEGVIRIRMVCTLYCLCGMMDCMANMIRGLGHSLLPMIVTIFGACGLRLLWIFTGFRFVEKFHSMNSLLATYPVSWFATWSTLVVCFVIIYKKEFKNKISGEA